MGKFAEIVKGTTHIHFLACGHIEDGQVNRAATAMSGLGIDIAIGKGFQHGDHFPGVSRGEKAAAEEGDDHRQDPGDAADQSLAIAAPGTDGHNEQ